jgi:replication-associated recombination protein RarA
MIVNGSAYSIILVGSPGLGKSTVVERCLQQYKVRYAMNKGVATPKALYRMLYEANGNVLVLDDSDSVLRDKNAQNILKAALDNKLQRKISWTSEARSRHYLPQSFIYTGRIIFISNIPLDRFPEALRSRSYLCEVDGGRMEKLEYVLSMMANYPQSEQVKAEIRAFLVENALNLREISLRSLDKIITLRTQFPTDWKTIALKSI